MTTPALPAGATALSVGFSVRSTGTLVADDFVIQDADQTAPTVAMTSPRDNSLVRGQVALAATASDASDIDHVDFLVNGTVVGTATSAPWTAMWDTTATADTVVGVAARAYDTAGNVATSTSLMETIGNSTPADTTPPTVVLTQPASGSTSHGIVHLAATAADNDQVSVVSFQVDGHDVGTSSTAPYTFDWDSSQQADGPVTLTATAIDRSGNVTVSDIATITLDNRAADTTAPVSTATCAGGCPTGWVASPVSVSLSATDAGSGVDRIVYTTDGSEPTGTHGATYAAALSVTSPTTLSWRAIDLAGNLEPVQTMRLLVDTTAPSSVAITSPVNGATVSGLTPIQTVSADDTGVVRVKFWIDGVQVGSRTTAPLQWNWDTTTVAAGQHTLQVAALDAAGNYLKSTVVTVTVTH